MNELVQAEAGERMQQRIKQIDLMLERGRLDEARSLIAGEIQDRPDDSELLVRLACAHLIDDDLDAAIAQLREVLHLDPEHFSARFSLAASLIDKQEYPEAEQLLISLLRSDPTDVECLALYSKLMLLSLKFEKARKLSEEAQRLDPEGRDAIRSVALVAMVDGKPAERRQAVGHLISEFPDDENIARLLLQSLIEDGRHRDAKLIVQGLLREQPDDPHLVALIIELNVLDHPLSWPVYPLVKWGWPASAVAWGLFIVARLLLKKFLPHQANPLSFLYLGWLIYSWVYPPLLTRFFRWRGVS